MPLIGRRIGRPGLLGLAARTAVVAGTAGAVSNSMQRRQTAQAQEDYQAQAYQDEQAQQQMAAVAAQQAPAAPPAGGDTIAELERLASLKQQGLLSEEEFAAAKARLLGI